VFGVADRDVRRLFDTHSHSWREAGLARQLSRRAVQRARLETALLVPLIAGILLLYDRRKHIADGQFDVAIRVGAVLALLILGWQVARAIGRALGPMLFRRMQPGTAGTVGFVIRLVTILVAVFVAARIAGLTPRTLALGGAFTAVIVGLAAQQTLGNLIAGLVLLSVRPFRVGDRVRLQAGGLAGQTEGIVSSLGLFYTTLSAGEDQIMVPNSVVIASAVVPLREPAGVDLRARLRPGVTPIEVQDAIQSAITTPLREPPRVLLEEIDGDEVVVRIVATPEHDADGPHLATEVLGAVARQTVRAAG
jgi:small conductance mechanosensitive channel